MSPAAVHLRSPINSSSVQNPDTVPDATPHSPLHHTPFPHFNADSLNPTAAAAHSTARGFGRSRPRLAKVRKQSASQHARSRSRTAAAGDAAASSGFNPFRSAASESSDQVTGNISALNGFGNTGFVFGARRGDSASASDSNSEQGGEGTTEKETEFKKSGHVDFVFSAKRSDVEVESNSLPKNASENATNSVCRDERKMGLNSELKDGFVSCADQNDLVYNSNTEKGKSSECVENSGFDDGGESKCKTEVECERRDCFGFVFGDNHNFNMGKQESLDSMRNSDNFNTKTETNSNSKADADQYDHLGNDDKSKSGYGNNNGIFTAYSAIPEYKLPDEMKKLNINHSEDADITRDSKNSYVNSSAGFVFGASENVCGYFSASSGTHAGGQQSCTNAAFENIGGQYFKACKTNDVQSGTGCGIACGSTGIPCSKPSTSQEGTRDFQCGKIPECYAPEDSEVSGAKASSSLSSFGLDSYPNNYTSTGHSLSADHDTHDNCFTSIPEASKESFMEFKPPTWDPSCFKENLFPKLNKKLESTQKGRSSKEKGSKQMRRKLKPHSLNKKQTGLDHLSKENSSLETPDSSGSHSPMDFSPYQEAGADDQDVKASEELNDLHSTSPTDYKDEHLAAVGIGVDINTTDHRCGDPDNDKFLSHNGSSSFGDFHSSGPEVVWPNLKTEQFSSSSIAGASADAGVDFNSNTEREKADLFCFGHDLGDSNEKDFAFSASSIVEGTSSSSKRKQKKKFGRTMGHDSFIISPNLNGRFGSSVQFSPLTTANMSSHSDVEGTSSSFKQKQMRKFRRTVVDRSQINVQFKEGDVASSATIQEACDKWRLRGNQAYKDGDVSKAEDFYTLGINSVPSSERSGCWIKPLSLCYSNRAAARMSLGRIREALGDCMMANALEPTFLKVQMRTAK